MATAAPPRYVCFLCKRKFKTAALLTRHKQLSELHRRNLVQQDDEISKKKEELRQSIGQIRKQTQDIEAAIGKQGHDEDLQNQRTMLECKYRQILSEYGQAQEKLEASRFMQQVERAAGSGRSTQLSEMHETRVGKLLVSAGAASWQGNKDVQEDRFILDLELDAAEGKKVVGFCVFDGHSGSLCVDALVEWLPRNLQKCLMAKSALNEENLRSAVHEACVLTDDEFLSKAREREVLDGSTMIMCLIFVDESRAAADGGRSRGGHRILIANLGDSRAVLCRTQAQPGGKISALRLSEDHKPGRDDERRRIESKGGVVDVQGVWRVFTPGPAAFAGRSVLWGLAVSRAFGDILMKEANRYGVAGVTGPLVIANPEIRCFDLCPTEDRFLVLACDGVWDVLNDDDAISVCLEQSRADHAAHALIRRAFEIGSDDNITALVVAWQQSDEAAVEGEAGESKRTRNS